MSSLDKSGFIGCRGNLLQGLGARDGLCFQYLEKWVRVRASRHGEKVLIVATNRYSGKLMGFKSDMLFGLDEWMLADWSVAMAESFLSMGNKGPKAEPGQPHGKDPALLKDYPALHEWLVAGLWPDKSPKTASSLVVFFEDGSCKVCLTDRDWERSLWGTGKTLADALESVEERLASGCPDWRPSGKKKNRG
jgi:hypothetical protein